MAEENGTHVVRGMAAGIAGGLVASWLMNVFIEAAGPKITEAVESISGQKRNQARDEQHDQSAHDQGAKEDATMKAADAIVSTIGGRHLSFEEKQKGGPMMHYAFGAVMGGVYGVVAEYSPAARTGFGMAFGAALFTGADLVAVPALHLSGSSLDAPVSTLATPFTAHLVYGAITESVRRLVRALL